VYVSELDVPAARAVAAEKMHGLSLCLDNGIEAVRFAHRTMHERPGDRMVVEVGFVFEASHQGLLS
jgi:hypothetical protein